MSAVNLAGSLGVRFRASVASTPPLLSLTDVQVIAALGTVLQGMLPGVEIIRGQANMVPSPQAADYVVMTATSRRRLSTNVDTLALAGIAGLNRVQTAEQVDVQLDIHGPNSTDNAEVIKTRFRDDYACEAFAAQGVDVQPLYADDARQMPFINDQNLYEDRWVINVAMQGDFVITTPQQYANTLIAGLIEVDTTYRP